YMTAVRELANVAIVVSDFQSFVPYVTGVDLVFIDGDHDYDSVLRDINLAISISAQMVALHDWDFAEVREAAETVFRRDPSSIGGSVASFTNMGNELPRR